MKKLERFRSSFDNVSHSNPEQVTQEAKEVPCQKIQQSSGGDLQRNRRSTSTIMPTREYGRNKAFWPLCGRPHFDVILNQTHLDPDYYLDIPMTIQQELPEKNAPFHIQYCAKKWNAEYIVAAGPPKRAYIPWKSFVMDNNLKVGDAVVMELLMSSPTLVNARVQILRGDFPAELLNQVK